MLTSLLRLSVALDRNPLNKVILMLEVDAQGKVMLTPRGLLQGKLVAGLTEGCGRKKERS
jgi:hypothetical protein